MTMHDETKKQLEYKLEVMQAALDGKQIQIGVMCNGVDRWTDDQEPEWKWNKAHYRVKPEITYRPWQTTDEVPVTAIVKTKDGATKTHISSVQSADVPGKILIRIADAYEGNAVLAGRILDEYVLNDGRPCGVKQE